MFRYAHVGLPYKKRPVESPARLHYLISLRSGLDFSNNFGRIGLAWLTRIFWSGSLIRSLFRKSYHLGFSLFVLFVFIVIIERVPAALAGFLDP
jgi:hypothetical protein